MDAPVIYRNTLNTIELSIFNAYVVYSSSNAAMLRFIYEIINANYSYLSN